MFGLHLDSCELVVKKVVSLLPLPVWRVNFRFELQASIAETDSCNCLFAVYKFTLVHTEASSVNKAISEWLGTTSGRLLKKMRNRRGDKTAPCEIL